MPDNQILESATRDREMAFRDMLTDAECKLRDDYTMFLCKRKWEELRGKFIAFFQGEHCEHLEVLTYFHDSIGRIVFQRVCLRCLRRGINPKHKSLSLSEKESAIPRGALPDKQKLWNQYRAFVASWSGNWQAIYTLYLNSPDWNSTREKIKQRDGYTCQGFRFIDDAGHRLDFSGCTGKWNLEVHHLTYDRVTEELDDDLVTLCHSCHVKVKLYQRGQL